MLHGRQFGSKEVKDVYLRYQKYYHKAGLWKTDLKKEAITLDGFTMMNVIYAKSVFSEETICFQMSYIMNELKMETDIDTAVKYEYTWHRFNDVCQSIVTYSDPVRDYGLIPVINDNILVLSVRIPLTVMSTCIAAHSEHDARYDMTSVC